MFDICFLAVGRIRLTHYFNLLHMLWDLNGRVRNSAKFMPLDPNIFISASDARMDRQYWKLPVFAVVFAVGSLEMSMTLHKG